MTVKDVSADGIILVGTGNVKTGPVGWRADTDGAEPQVVFRTQFQLLF